MALNLKNVLAERKSVRLGSGGAGNAPFKNICDTNQFFLNHCGTGILLHGQPKTKEYDRNWIVSI
jgi:hypothetical protein